MVYGGMGNFVTEKYLAKKVAGKGKASSPVGQAHSPRQGLARRGFLKMHRALPKLALLRPLG